MKSETFNFTRYLSVEFRIHLFLHNPGVLNANLSNNILYLMSFTLKLAKQKMTSKSHTFFFLSHINTQFLFSTRFRVERCMSYLFRPKLPIFDLQKKWLLLAHKWKRFYESEL